MQHNVKSIRPFIGAKDFSVSREFYAALEFEEVRISNDMSYFCIEERFGFYLQDCCVDAWIDNTMLFLEVENLDEHRARILLLDLPGRFAGVRVSGIRDSDWGREYFIHDPSSILWHIGCFQQ